MWPNLQQQEQTIVSEDIMTRMRRLQIGGEVMTTREKMALAAGMSSEGKLKMIQPAHDRAMASAIALIAQKRGITLKPEEFKINRFLTERKELREAEKSGNREAAIGKGNLDTAAMEDKDIYDA